MNSLRLLGRRSARSGQNDSPRSRPSSGRSRRLRISGRRVPISPAPTVRAGTLEDAPREAARRWSSAAPDARRGVAGVRRRTGRSREIPGRDGSRTSARRHHGPLPSPHRAGHAARSAAEDHKTAELIFRDILKLDPSHVGALCGLAAVSLTASRPQDAVRLLQARAQAVGASAARLARSFASPARARALFPRPRRQYAASSKSRARTPTIGCYSQPCTRASCVKRTHCAAFEEAARMNPGEVRLRLSIGHLNKTLGRRTRVRAGLQAVPRDGPGHGRGVLEPGGPEELRVLGRRDRLHAVRF